jgi:DNA-binding transcriptional regulator YhcF (GntR family)
MNEESTNDQNPVAVGTWIGREQAFNTMAHHCSAARVACLKQIRDTEAYKHFNLTWEQFCPDQAGLSRKHADRLIAQLAEFGAPYFQLTDIVPVSPAAFRQIEPTIVDGVLEFHGEQIPITRENAVKIKAAVNALRKEVEQVKSDTYVRTPPDITSLQIRFDAFCGGLHHMVNLANTDEKKAGLRPLIVYSINKLNDQLRRLG